MEQVLQLTDPRRRAGSYYRNELKNDVLYGFFRYRELSISFAKKSGVPANATDLFALGMIRDGLMDRQQYTNYIDQVKALFATPELVAEYDDYSVEALYQLICKLRRRALGPQLLEQANALQLSKINVDWDYGIHQKAQEEALLEACNSVILVLCQPELLSMLMDDLYHAFSLGKTVYIAVSPQPGHTLPTKSLLLEHLPEGSKARFLPADERGIAYDATLQSQIDAQNACLFVYGEEGLLHCRSLKVDAVVHAVPRGYYAQTLVNQLGMVRPCVVYVPKHFDITDWVRLKERTRVSYWQLAQLQKAYGDEIYRCTVPELYAKYPDYFVNIYQNGPVFEKSPLALELPDSDDVLATFDRCREQAIADYWSGFDNIRYHAAYFDENLEQKPMCMDSSCKQKGILVHAVQVKKARDSRVIPCDPHTPLREMFSKGQTGIVSNFLFFMTGKLATLYNDLRKDRPHEQADVATGHLDYMLCYKDGKRIETFPLFRKTCIAMKNNGEFLFFPFRLGGGSIQVAGQNLRWEAQDVDSDSEAIRVYTPYQSRAHEDADRQTYRKLVGENRVNLVILQDRICSLRAGDVVLPSVGVVISLSPQAAQPLLEQLTPTEDGYYDVSGLEMTVQLDPPKQVEPAVWSQVRWAYGGGLSLILAGVGLCDGNHMEQWFAEEGWKSPLSRQTQESTLHELVKHPRTAVGVLKNGDLVVLVFSGRTWRSTGANYDQMCKIARFLFGDVEYLMNMDGGGSAVLGMVADGSFMELSCPSTSAGSCVGMVRPIHTVLFIPAQKQGGDCND